MRFDLVVTFVGLLVKSMGSNSESVFFVDWFLHSCWFISRLFCSVRVLGILFVVCCLSRRICPCIMSSGLVFLTSFSLAFFFFFFFFFFAGLLEFIIGRLGDGLLFNFIA